MRTIDELYEQYRKYGEEKDTLEEIVAILKVEIKEQRTKIAAQVLSAVDEKGKMIYSNDMKRSVEIDRRAMLDKVIGDKQAKIYEHTKRIRWLEREMQIVSWQVEARVRSPRVV